MVWTKKKFHQSSPKSSSKVPLRNFFEELLYCFYFFEELLYCFYLNLDKSSSKKFLRGTFEELFWADLGPEKKWTPKMQQ